MIKEKIKSLVEKKTAGNSKKNTENLLVFLILLIITIISINIIWKKDNNTKTKQKVDENYKVLATDDMKESNIQQQQEYNLEDELEKVLSNIAGVGEVQVLITYSQTSEIVAMSNKTVNTSKTEEADSNGGTRKIETTDEKKEIIVDSDSNPITEKVILPKIEGAIIIAQGGDNATVKTNVVQAVSAVTGLSTHKIQVFKMSK